MIVAEKKLTAKQQRFCDEYLICLNGSEAAIKAGYSEKTARQMAVENLAKPNIKAYIQQRMDEKEKELIADGDEVLKYLTAVMRGKSESSVLARDETGADRVILKPPDEKERTKAAELLGKAHMLFTDKVDMGASVSVVIVDDIENS